jgi:hypothetical protein
VLLLSSMNLMLIPLAGPADVSVTVQDTCAEDSLAIKASVDVFAEVKDHVVASQHTCAEDSLAIKSSADVFVEVKDHVVASQFLLPEHGIDCDSVEESLEPNLQSQSSSDVQDLASKDSHMNVVVDDGLGSHNSESEYTTDWESDEDDESDASSPESQEINSDDDAETEEKDPEAPVLPEDQMVGFEKLESKMEESDQLVNKSNTIIDNDSGSEYTTDWESDEDDESDASSPESQEINSDDDAETEEKDPEAPVLPEDQMVGFEKLESKMEESDQLVNKSNTIIDNDSGSESFIAEHSEIESVDSADEESLNDDHVMVEDYMIEAEEVAVKFNDHTLDEIPKFKKNISPGLVISDSEVTLSTVATNSLSEDPMAKVQESSKSETLVDVCVMPASESLAKTPTDLISDSEVTCKIPSQPFAADQISGQFPRPTQLTQKKSSDIKESIQKITDVSDDDDEELDNGNGKLELEKEKAKQDENTVDGDSILEMYTGVSSVDGDDMLSMFAGMSLRQLRKKVKMELQITHDRKNIKDKSTTKVSLLSLSLSLSLSHLY